MLFHSLIEEIKQIIFRCNFRLKASQNCMLLSFGGSMVFENLLIGQKQLENLRLDRRNSPLALSVCVWGEGVSITL